MVIGADALNKDNLEVECLWSSKQIVLGRELDLDLYSITLPSEKIIGSKNLLGLPCFGHGNRILTLRGAQELRGNMTH